MSRRPVRLLLVPAALFVVVSATVFTLAQLHPVKHRAASAPTIVSVVVDPLHGKMLFAEKCSTCHGEGGAGGGVGPKLLGSALSLDIARGTIENGNGVMPAGLVSGQDLEDVLAFLKTILG